MKLILNDTETLIELPTVHRDGSRINNAETAAISESTTLSDSRMNRAETHVNIFINVRAFMPVESTVHRDA